MNKNELCNRIREVNPGMTIKAATLTVNTCFAAIVDGLINDGEASFPNFGSFSVKHIPEHEGRNPQTGETMLIPAKNRVIFKPYKALKTAIN